MKACNEFGTEPQPDSGQFLSIPYWAESLLPFKLLLITYLTFLVMTLMKA